MFKKKRVLDPYIIVKDIIQDDFGAATHRVILECRKCDETFPMDLYPDVNGELHGSANTIVKTHRAGCP